MEEIFVDFDGTICPNKNTVEEYPPPTADCLNVLRKLSENYDIVIYSVRSNKKATRRPKGHTEMVAYLAEHGVPYTRIVCNKEHFLCLIDDKCVGVPMDGHGNVSWEHIANILKSKDYM